jgi:hypothetical protein
MIGVVLVAVLSGAPIGACADRTACRFKLADDPSLQQALAALGLTSGELKAEPLKKPAGDLAFSVSFTRVDDQVVVKAVSLHRPPSIYGEGAAKVLPVNKPEWKQRALVSALKVALGAALEDLAGRISGVRKVKLSAQVNGLNLKTREHVEKSLLPCLKSLFDLVGPVTSAEEQSGYLDESLEYLAEKDEPRVSLDWQAARLRAAILGGTRSKCSVAGSPLQGWSTFVTADALNGAVVVSFKR